jgi:predicted RNase H-like nuclease (RuvC/YqgF family)
VNKDKPGVVLGRNAIVGIDPGVNTAVAILDLDGEIVNIKSSRQFSLKKVLEFVSGQCTPLMIASDVFPAPKLLGKVAAAFSAGIYEPSENFSRTAKSKLVRIYEISERERHKKDALAAAVSAYESKLPVIRKIRRKISESGLEGRIDTGDVARMIFSGESNNIKSAIEKLKDEN